jgi:septum formation inhibitor MinC
MNLNDDFFLSAELWAARKTPINKPVNDSHEQTKIIGHMIDAWVLDKSDASVVPDNTPDDEVPNAIDIANAFVIYQIIYPEEAEAIVEDEKFVSMEVLFFDFDYAMVKDDVLEIVKREESTAFLTKHLRAYGGSGEYNGKKVGRVLRKMVFAGKGIVDKPANPDSVINSIGSLKVAKGDLNMDVDKLQARIDELEADNKSLKQEIADAGKADLSAKVDDLTSKNESLSAELDETKTKLTEANEQLEAVKAELDEAKNSLTEIGKDKIAQDRIGKLQEAGYSVEDAEAETDKLREMTDEQFEATLSYISSALKQKAESEEDEEVDETIQDAEADAESTAQEAIEDAETEDTSAPSASDAEVDDQDDNVAASLAEVLVHGTQKED